MKKISHLQKKYPRFFYHQWQYHFDRKNLKISFVFEIEKEFVFHPEIIIAGIGKKEKMRIKNNSELFSNLVFHLGLIELLSYWKATCAPKIIIKAGFLNKQQIRWWQSFIFKGMGQFFFENKINFKKKGFLKIAVSNKNRAFKKEKIKPKSRFLIAIGGGKDSLMSLEIIKKKTNNDYNCFSLNPNPVIERIFSIACCQDPIRVKRKIDPLLLELNQRGFLNGHTPFSAYLYFLGLLLGFIFDFKYIVFSNEKSADEGNLFYLNTEINHQYSKSFAFEKKFRKYNYSFITEEIEVFSLLRPLYEIQIAKIFAQLGKPYFNVFLSCNEALKTYSGRKKPTYQWCGQCPKCLFVFMVLDPFLSQEQMKTIFSQNLFEKKELLPLLLKLVEKKQTKPFECVGTKKEALISLYLSWKKIKTEKKKIPVLLDFFSNTFLKEKPRLEKQAKKILSQWDKNNFVPSLFQKEIKKYV